MIGIVALIIFGPRKLPDLMRRFGKAMAEFRRSTNEFKESWEKEVDIDSIKKEFSGEDLLTGETQNSISRENQQNEFEKDLMVPEIKEIKGEDFERISSQTSGESLTSEPTTDLDDEQTDDSGSKQDWL